MRLKRQKFIESKMVELQKEKKKRENRINKKRKVIYIASTDKERIKLEQDDNSSCIKKQVVDSPQSNSSSNSTELSSETKSSIPNSKDFALKYTPEVVIEENENSEDEM